MPVKFLKMSKKKLYKVFLIAGSEPLGSAGIQADIKAVSACGAYAAGALTTIVDEDTHRVKSVHPLPVDIVVGQASSFLGDLGAECIKTGMLYSRELVEAIGELLGGYPSIPKVIDPVMVASSGFQLIKDDAVRAYMDRLFGQATIITPNRHEAELILGRRLTCLEDLKDLSRWGNAVVVKSMEGPCEGVETLPVMISSIHRKSEILYDWYFNPSDGTSAVFAKPKIDTNNVNGTGDTFASAIAAYIARGIELNEAVSRAEVFIYEAIRHGKEYEFGDFFGPVSPFYDNF